MLANNMSCIKYYNAVEDAKSTLFCFHYAGGNASMYSTWHRHLPSDVAVCAIQLPGRMNLAQLAPHTEITTVVSFLQKEIVQAIGDKPYSFFGYSLGALVAFELVHKLLKNHHKLPDKLMVAACRAPQAAKSDEVISTLSEQELIHKLASYNGTPAEVLENKELMNLLLPIIRADFLMNENYQYVHQSKLPCPIIAYGGVDDLTVSSEDLQLWQQETSDTFSMNLFASDHFFIHKTDRELINELNKEILR